MKEFGELPRTALVPSLPHLPEVRGMRKAGRPWRPGVRLVVSPRHLAGIRARKEAAA